MCKFLPCRDGQNLLDVKKCYHGFRNIDKNVNSLLFPFELLSTKVLTISSVLWNSSQTHCSNNVSDGPKCPLHKISPPRPCIKLPLLKPGTVCHEISFRDLFIGTSDRSQFCAKFICGAGTFTYLISRVRSKEYEIWNTFL